MRLWMKIVPAVFVVFGVSFLYVGAIVEYPADVPAVEIPLESDSRLVARFSVGGWAALIPRERLRLGRFSSERS